MFRLSRGLLAATALMLPLATTASAATVSISTDEGKNYSTQYGFDEYTSVFGYQMEGMEVTANFADGSSETLIWEQIGRWDGGVIGSAFSLTFGSTDFILSTTQLLTSLVMETGDSLAIFDMLTGKGDIPTNTLGSKHGFPYSTTGGDTLFGSILVTYSNGLYLGDSRAEDTYTKMTVDYSGLDGGGLLGTTRFTTDLDNLAVAGDLSPMPLPAGGPLLVAGMLGFGLVRRKRR